MKKIVNAKTFIIPCMRAGLCQYDDERVHVPQSALERMKETAYGLPITIDHISQEALEAQRENVIVGRVAEMHYDGDTDLWMAHCVVETQDAIDKLEAKWGVSTSYEVLKKGAGGTLNAVDYDSTIEDGRYLHLAIVEHPRYEMAVNPTFYNAADLTPEKHTLTIVNVISENNEGVPMFKLFKTKREEVKENSSDVEIEVDGEKVSLNALVEAYKASKVVPVDVEHVVPAEENEMDKEVSELLSSVEIEIGKEEEEKEVMEMAAEQKCAEIMPDEMKKENEEEEEKPEEKEEEQNKYNSFSGGLAASDERFNSLKAAAFKSVIDNGANGFQTISERAALGRAKYGSKK
jgi:hypothetical protein